MLTVKQMIAKVRQTVHDTKELEYSDVELTNYLDDGNRVLRRTAMSIYPEVLVSSLEGQNVEEYTDEEGNTQEKIVSQIVSENPLTRVLRVVLDGKQLVPIGRSEINDYKDDTTQPLFYYMTGFNTINLFPEAKAKYDYRIDYISDLSLFDLQDDASPYPLVLDDLLVEYAVFRSSISDEFNMQKETTLISTIVEQIEDVLRNLTPIKTEVMGYWDSGKHPIRRW